MEQPDKPVKLVEGPRIYLRPLEIKDETACRRWRNDPATRININAFWPQTEIAQRRFIEGLANDDKNMALAIVLKEGDRCIGVTGLHNIRWKDRTAEFGILIGEADCLGQGYGTEATRLILRYAFRTLNLNRIQLGVWDFNAAAIRCYENLGFRREGTQRSHGFIEGRYVDFLVYGLLAEEFTDGASGGQP